MKIKSSIKKFFRGFAYASSGIAYAARTQINFRFHLAAAVWVLLLSHFYDLSRSEYAVLLLTIALVLSLEGVNTAIEKTVDLCTDEIKPLAKAAKDVSAGAVLIAAVFSVGVAFCLFWDTEVFSEIAAYFGGAPLMLVPLFAFAAATFVFIFAL